MNFPYQFGNKFPLPPPPFLPWNIPPFNPFPFAPALPNPSLYGPSSLYNPIYIEHQNNYFNLQQREFDKGQSTNPYFEKLINSTDKSAKVKQIFPFKNSNKPIDVIEISDEQAPIRAKPIKKKQVSKEKRIQFELKRLNNIKSTKKFNKQVEEQSAKIEPQKAVETEVRRTTRVSGKVPKEISYYDEIIDRPKQEPQEQQQQAIKKQQDPIFQGINVFKQSPPLINPKQLQEWKKALTQELLLRKMRNQQN